MAGAYANEVKMGRFYTIPLTPTSVAAAVDVFELLAAAGKPFILHEITLSQSSDFGDTQAEGLQVTIKRATGSFTSGTGGSSPTIAKHLTNDAACGITAELVNTTQASAGSGALTTMRNDSFNIQIGYSYLPPPEHRYLYLPTEACIVSISAPADAITLLGNAVVEEL